MTTIIKKIVIKNKKIKVINSDFEILFAYVYSSLKISKFFISSLSIDSFIKSILSFP